MRFQQQHLSEKDWNDMVSVSVVLYFNNDGETVTDGENPLF